MTTAQQLHEAIQKGDLAAASALVSADASLVAGGGAAGMPPLMLSIYMKQSAIAKMLIDHGATVDCYAAAALGDTPRLREMLASDAAKLVEHSSDGWTVLHLACFFGQLETVEMLLEKGANVRDQSANTMANQPLHAAAAGRHGEIVAMLLAAGADVNARQSGGYAPLHAAAANGDESMVRMFLAHEADRSAGTEKGLMPIDMARDKGHMHIVELLSQS